MKVRRFASVVLVPVLALAAAGSCGDDDDDDSGSPSASTTGDTSANSIQITEAEYAFTVNGDLKGGTATFEVENTGDETHEIGMAKLAAGKTMADVTKALAAATEDENPLDGVVEDDNPIDDAGGIQTPGTKLGVTISGVEPGEYVLICFLPDPEGKPHFSKGMVSSFTVSEGTSSTTPAADTTYTTTEEGLEGPEKLDAGPTTINVVNDSPINREIILLKITDGKTVDDVQAFFKAAEDGPPDFAKAPVDFFTFVFDAEQDRFLTVDLTPGTWAIVTPDPEKPSDLPPGQDPFGKLVEVT